MIKAKTAAGRLHTAYRVLTTHRPQMAIDDERSSVQHLYVKRSRIPVSAIRPSTTKSYQGTPHTPDR